MRPFIWSASCAFSTAMALVSPDARAQAPTAASSALAEALFQEARGLFQRERYAEACAKFAESQRLEAKLGTLLRLALCHEKTGQTATAWAEYTAAAELASRQGYKERETFARERVEALGAKLPRIVVTASEPATGLVITLDDKPFDPALLNTPLPIDPGKHRIGATAPGKKDWSRTIEIPSERADVPLEIPVLESVSPVVPPAVKPLSPPVTVQNAQKPPGPPAPQPGERRTLAYIGFGVGAAGVLVGVITGSVAWSKSGPVIDACPGGHCPLDQADALDDVTRWANASNVAFAFGAAGAVTGVIGLVMGWQAAAPARPSASVTPVIGPGTLGLDGRF